MTTKQVTTSMTFEVTVTLSGTETADETGADISNVWMGEIDVNGFTHDCLLDAARYMRDEAAKGDWTDEH